ncbi:branched-chain amino acid transaminase [Fodinicola feengrottensis]|uniref:Branched-chain amino acid transaminase n=1 Tax=Fodinicola feengrottensis TaxID=435914 RepID=A0ABN2FYK4_9ACTN
MTNVHNPFGAPCPQVAVEGEIVPADEARISVHANALSYGTGTFEGIRAFWNAEHEQLYLFEGAAHYQRLHRSARILGLPLRFSVDELVAMTHDLLRANDVRTDAYVRPLLLLSGEVLPVRMHDIDSRLSIAVTPVVGDYANPSGLRCMVSTWRRASDASTPIRAKVIGSYVGPALAKTEAVRAGYDEALMLTGDGFVAEATTANIMVRFGKTWSTPIGTDDILAGITRQQLLELIPEITTAKVDERRVHRSELYAADEVLLCGTASIVSSVVDIDGRRIGSGRPGEQALRLRHDLQAIARRQTTQHQEWTTAVYEKE